MRLRVFGRVALAAGLALGAAGLTVAEDEPIDRAVQSGVAHERLAMNWTSDADDDVILLVRTTLEPGAEIPPSVFHGDWAARVDAGTLSVTGVEGHVVIRRGGLNPGKTREVAAGKTLESYADAVMAWANEGVEPVTVLSAVEVDYGEDPITRFDAEAGFEDAFQDTVVKRVVIEGLDWLDEPYRIVVRDHSGRLVDAREPSEAELRWLETAFPLPEAGVAFGPDAFLRTDVWELMVRWLGGRCGPDATIDIGQDVAAIRVNDTTRTNCDAVGVTRWLVLTLRGDRVEPDEIEGQVQYHGR